MARMRDRNLPNAEFADASRGSSPKETVPSGIPTAGQVGSDSHDSEARVQELEHINQLQAQVIAKLGDAVATRRPLQRPYQNEERQYSEAELMEMLSRSRALVEMEKAAHEAEEEQRRVRASSSMAHAHDGDP